jgi:hypothetical protein
MTSDRAKAQTTEIVTDDLDNDDDLEVIEDDAPYVKWDHYPMTVDFKVADIEEGKDFAGKPCPVVTGELLKSLDGRDIGEAIRIGGGQMKLRRLIEKGIAADKIKPGARVVITHTRMLGQMKDFTLAANPISFAEFDRSAEKAPF